ncbi:MFS transporter [Pseudomonas sp. JDS28PS106]
MAMCVAMLIASEFMPVSLLTPIASDLGATQGMAGQAISVSGLFAVITSLLTPVIAGRFDRKFVLLGMTGLMLLSLILIAAAPSFSFLMIARAFLGMAVGGFWALATATVMKLVPEDQVPKALGLIYTGNAMATAFAAPIGSYMGGMIGWRGVFWGLVPLVMINLIWQWVSMPKIPPKGRTSAGQIFSLLKRSNVAFAMIAIMCIFSGAFCTFTYLRPFLETYTQVTVTQLSLFLLGLGLAGFVGTYAATALATTRLYPLIRCLPLLLAAATVAILGVGHDKFGVALLMIFWGGLNAAIPVGWSTWLSKGIADDPESGGGLLVAAIQLAIMIGGAFGGVLLDHVSIAATFTGGAALLLCGALVVGDGSRLRA